VSKYTIGECDMTAKRHLAVYFSRPNRCYPFTLNKSYYVITYRVIMYGDTETHSRRVNGFT